MTKGEFVTGFLLMVLPISMAVLLSIQMAIYDLLHVLQSGRVSMKYQKRNPRIGNRKLK